MTAFTRRGDPRLLGCWVVLVAACSAQWVGPEVVAQSFLWIPVVVSAIFASPRAVAALTVAATVLSIVSGLHAGVPNSPYFVGRVVAWTLVGVACVLLARQRADREARLADLAMHDPLTGVGNRRLLAERLGAQLSVRDRTATSAILYADVDRLKEVNDSYGHATGDAVLVTLAQRLHACVRKEDTVARVGGDEFVIACPEVRGLAGVEALCQRVMKSLATAVATPAGPFRVSLTLGAVIVPPGDPRTVEALLDAADRVLVALKATDKGSYRIANLGEPGANRRLQRSSTGRDC